MMDMLMDFMTNPHNSDDCTNRNKEKHPMKLEAIIAKIEEYRRAKDLRTAHDIDANSALAVSKAAELNRAVYKLSAGHTGGSHEKIEELALDLVVIGFGMLGTLDHTPREELWSKLEALVEKNATRDFSDPL